MKRFELNIGGLPARATRCFFDDDDCLLSRSNYDRAPAEFANLEFVVKLPRNWTGTLDQVFEKLKPEIKYKYSHYDLVYKSKCNELSIAIYSLDRSCLTEIASEINRIKKIENNRRSRLLKKQQELRSELQKIESKLDY